MEEILTVSIILLAAIGGVGLIWFTEGILAAGITLILCGLILGIAFGAFDRWL